MVQFESVTTCIGLLLLDQLVALFTRTEGTFDVVLLFLQPGCSILNIPLALYKPMSAFEHVQTSNYFRTSQPELSF